MAYPSWAGHRVCRYPFRSPGSGRAPGSVLLDPTVAASTSPLLASPERMREIVLPPDRVASRTRGRRPCAAPRRWDEPMSLAELAVETRVVLLLAGVVFLWALALGVLKYAQMSQSAQAVAHPYTDIAHRAALMYSFAIALMAVLVELSAFDGWVNLLASLEPIVFFVSTYGSYLVRHSDVYSSR